MAATYPNISACTSATFSTVPVPFGASLLATAASVCNLSRDITFLDRQWAPPLGNVTASFCNVTLTYTHPGQDDRVTVETWLPLEDYNGRFQSIGGGGFVAGRSGSVYGGMLGAVAEGFAAASSDAGLLDRNGAVVDQDGAVGDWALVGPGNVNLWKMENLGSRSLGEGAQITKDVVAAFFGAPPEYSYFAGCSQGGRQGLALAQRYPEAYDGILAAAPAVYIAQILGTIHWPQQFMNTLGEFPYNCETLAITRAAVAFCDRFDGVEDGVIGEPDLCLATFDPYSLVGTVVENCSDTGSAVTITEAAAKVSEATWKGPVSPDGTGLWPGPSIGSGISHDPAVALLPTGNTGTINGSVAAPIKLGTDWLRFFLANDADFNVTNVTDAEYARLVKTGAKRYSSILDAPDPDMSDFQNAGGKILTFHGLADSLIPVKGMQRYYNAVLASAHSKGNHAQDFYRLFEAPGIDHCVQGPGGQPYAAFALLRAWVENGTVPETVPVMYDDAKGVEQKRVLCPYPQKPRLVERGADPTERESWRCVLDTSLVLQTAGGP